MFDLTVVDATLAATQTLSASQVQAAGIFDTVTNLSNDAMTALKAVATLVVACICLFRISKAGFALGAIVMYGIAAGAVLWLVWGGTGTFQQGIHDQVDNANAAVVLEHTDRAA